MTIIIIYIPTITTPPGLYPGQADGHLHGHGLVLVIHLGHLQHAHPHVHRHGRAL